MKISSNYNSIIIESIIIEWYPYLSREGIPAISWRCCVFQKINKRKWWKNGGDGGNLRLMKLVGDTSLITAVFVKLTRNGWLTTFYEYVIIRVIFSFLTVRWYREEWGRIRERMMKRYNMSTRDGRDARTGVVVYNMYIAYMCVCVCERERVGVA